MVAETGIYITWVTGAILISIAMMPIFKPPFARISADGFIDMFRRYWAHMIVVFSVYLWKDLLDGLDMVLMANTQLDRRTEERTTGRIHDTFLRHGVHDCNLRFICLPDLLR